MTTTWFDGELRPLGESKVSLLAHTLHYGVGVFEGVRCYPQASGDECSIFRLDDHLRRLADSAKVCGLELPFDRATLSKACVDVLQANAFTNAYLRPVVWQDDASLSGLGSSPTVHVAVAAQPWGAYLGEEGLRKGIRVRVSAYRRGGHGSFFSRAKINGQYVASTLAKREALALGLDEALLTDDKGHVCEGSGENLFMVRDGVLITPPGSAAILPGITRATVLHIAQTHREEFGIRAIREDEIPRDALLLADEVFLTGTAAEVTPVREVDLRQIGAGEAGPITRKIQDAYFALVRGEVEAPAKWRTPFGAAVR
ncbi:MAG: branched chain amino acid aminotransferase [Planctomycetota bacterium]|nr:MAG: branched chain amino acid aminotransferase [Planctomycetota bacterium]